MKGFREIADDAAEKLRADCGGDNKLEFLAWLDIALKRESMVSVIYQDQRVKKQIDAWAEKVKVPYPVAAIIMRALLAVWAQEKAHQSYFATMLRGIKPDAETSSKTGLLLTKIQGQIEGMVVASKVGKSRFNRFCAKVAIIVGKQTTGVPPYVESLHEKNFSEYCAINSDLEHTAVAGYSRMFKLGKLMLDSSMFTDSTLLYDLHITKMQETYHEKLFELLAGWPPDSPDSGTRPDTSPFDPVGVTNEVMTEAAARNIILQAKQHAFGAEYAALGSSNIEVNEWKIFNDPIILILKAYANHGAKAQTEQVAKAVHEAFADQGSRGYVSHEFAKPATEENVEEDREKYFTAED